MLKKTVAFGSFLTVLCASSTLAHGSNFKSGFIAGAHVGYSFGNGKFNSTFDTNGQFGVGSASGNAKKNSALLGILAGYRHIFHSGFTIGVDISGNVFTNNELNKQLNHIEGLNFPFKNKISRRYSITPSLNVGKVFCDRWHATIGLGLAIASFKQEVTNLSSVGGVIKSANATTTKVGFAPSVGVEYAATQNVSIIGNVSYEIYKKTNKTFDDQLTRPFAVGTSYKSSISPQYLTLKVGAVYRF